MEFQSPKAYADEKTIWMNNLNHVAYPNHALLSPTPRNDDISNQHQEFHPIQPNHTHQGSSLYPGTTIPSEGTVNDLNFWTDLSAFIGTSHQSKRNNEEQAYSSFTNGMHERFNISTTITSRPSHTTAFIEAGCSSIIEFTNKDEHPKDKTSNGVTSQHAGKRVYTTAAEKTRASPSPRPPALPSFSGTGYSVEEQVEQDYSPPEFLRASEIIYPDEVYHSDVSIHQTIDHQRSNLNNNSSFGIKVSPLHQYYNSYYRFLNTLTNEERNQMPKNPPLPQSWVDCQGIITGKAAQHYHETSDHSLTLPEAEAIENLKRICLQKSKPSEAASVVQFVHGGIDITTTTIAKTTRTAQDQSPSKVDTNSTLRKRFREYETDKTSCPPTARVRRSVADNSSL